MTTRKAIVGLALALSLSLGATSCGLFQQTTAGPGQQSGQPSAAAPAATQAVQRYPAPVESAFMQQCQARGASQAQCSCGLREVESRYSVDQAARLTEAQQQEIMDRCRSAS